MIEVLRPAAYPLLGATSVSRRGCPQRSVCVRSYPERNFSKNAVYSDDDPKRKRLLDLREEDDEEDDVEAVSLGGSVATLIFGAALLSERLNGVGIVQSVELHNKGAHPLLLGSIVGLLAAAVWPGQSSMLNMELTPISPVVKMKALVARLAFVGLAAAIAAEMITGKGVLALLDIETGVEVLSDVEAVLAFMVMIILTGPSKRTK